MVNQPAKERDLKKNNILDVQSSKLSDLSVRLSTRTQNGNMSWKPSITPVPSSSCSCGPTVPPPTSVTLSALSLSGSGQRSEQRRPTVTWLLRKKAPGFSPKDEPSHCHHWKHKSVPWTSEKKKSRPWSHVRSGDINHGEASNDIANLAMMVTMFILYNATQI